MDLYYPKTRKPRQASLKRTDPIATVAPPPPLPATPKKARLPRPKECPPVKKKSRQRLLLTNDGEGTTSTNLEVKSHPLIFTPLRIPSPDPTPATITEPVPIAPEPAPESEPQQIPKLKPKEPTTSIKSPTKIQTGPLRGVSSSLLELIRKKQAAKNTPEVEHKEKLLDAAPRITSAIYHNAPLRAGKILPYEKALENAIKALDSNFTSSFIIEVLELMDKIAPGWLSYVTISRGKYMRMHKDLYSPKAIEKAIKEYTIQFKKDLIQN